MWLVVGLAVLIGVGAMVVLTVVWPARYAKGVLELDRAFRSSDSPFASSAPLSGDDVEGTLRRVNASRAFLTEMEEKIRALRPAPFQYRQLQEDLEVGVHGLLEQIAALERAVTAASVPSVSSQALASPPPELRARLDRISTTLDALRERYPEYVLE